MQINRLLRRPGPLLPYTGTRSLTDYQYLWVLEKVISETEFVEVETLFAITQFDSNLEAARLFDIIDRLYSLLMRQWQDWKG